MTKDRNSISKHLHEEHWYVKLVKDSYMDPLSQNSVCVCVCVRAHARAHVGVSAGVDCAHKYLHQKQ